jgi:hypothetical protein
MMVVAAASAGIDKTLRPVDGKRGRIARGDLKKGGLGTAQARLIEKARDKPAAKAATPRFGCDSNGQKFGFASDGATDEEARVTFDQNKGQRIG